MTKEQAITRIKHSSMYIDDKETADYIIKALEQNTVSEEVYTQEHFARKEAEQKLWELQQNTSDDCVSRAEMLKYQQYLHGKMSNEENHKLWEFIKDLPPVTPTFPKGATNGDILKIVFPNIEADEIKTDTGGYIEVKYLDTTDKCDATAFRKNWWNTPYTGK